MCGISRYSILVLAARREMTFELLRIRKVQRNGNAAVVDGRLFYAGELEWLCVFMCEGALYVNTGWYSIQVFHKDNEKYDLP